MAGALIAEGHDPDGQFVRNPPVQTARRRLALWGTLALLADERFLTVLTLIVHAPRLIGPARARHRSVGFDSFVKLVGSEG